VCVCVMVFACVNMSAHVHVCVCAFMYAWVGVCVCMCVCVCVSAFLRICARVKFCCYEYRYFQKWIHNLMFDCAFLWGKQILFEILSGGGGGMSLEAEIWIIPGFSLSHGFASNYVGKRKKGLTRQEFEKNIFFPTNFSRGKKTTTLRKIGNLDHGSCSKKKRTVLLEAGKVLWGRGERKTSYSRREISSSRGSVSRAAKIWDTFVCMHICIYKYI